LEFWTLGFVCYLVLGIWCLLPYLFQDLGKPEGGFPFSGHVHGISVRKKESLGIAEGYTLGVSIAEIAFHRHAFLKVEGGVAERAGDDTGFTTNAKILIDDHPVIKIGFPVAGLGGAHLNAERFLAMITDHGKVDAFVFPLDHFDPRSARIA
jgi:hypothetical protein